MAKYSIAGAAGAASSAGATAGLVFVGNPAATSMSAAHIYEFSVGPGAAAEDSNYTIRLKRQTTSGTWTAVTPAPISPDFSTAVSLGGRASTASGAASTELGYWGFNQRGGFRWVAIPGGEFVVSNAFSGGITLEYVVVAGTAVNYATILYEE